MITYNDTAINAVNRGIDTPDAFYNKSTLIATSKWVNTDGWRGHTELTAEPGYKVIASDWVTGNWDDAPSGNSESEVLAKIEKLEKEHGNIWVIFTPTSNVFSTVYTVLAKDPTAKVAKGKTIAHKTKLFTDGDAWRVKYHATDVISYDGQGVYTLNSGGWKTVTTKKRINDHLPGGYFISQKNFEWTLHHISGSRPFTDGMTIGRA